MVSESEIRKLKIDLRVAEMDLVDCCGYNDLTFESDKQDELLKKIEKIRKQIGEFYENKRS